MTADDARAARDVELGELLAGLSLEDRRRVAAAWADSIRHRPPAPAPLVRPARGMHTGVVLYDRRRRVHWVQCTCGWASRGHVTEAAARAQHADHVTATQPPGATS